MAEDDFCYLTTVGRVSGRPHEIEIWYERDDAPGPPATIFLMAGGGRSSDWVANIAADPDVTVRFGSDPSPFSGRGRILDGRDGLDGDVIDPVEAERARTMVFTKYQARYDGDLTEWRARALPVAVDLG